MVEIREMQAADANEVLQINASVRPAVALLDRPELNRLLAVTGMHRIARRDAAIVGYLLAFASDSGYDGEEFLFFRRLLREPFIYVDQIAIAPAFRRQGIGNEFYSALFGQVLHRGAGTICCEVNVEPPNPGSLRFHRKLGFQKMGTLHTADGRFVTCLVRELKI